MLPINLENRIALVTGLSSGIGAGIAVTLARAGCDIAGCALSPPEDEAVTQLEQEVESLDRQWLYRQADMSSDEAIRNLVDDTIETFGRIDILVSNAGANIFEGASGCSLEKWEENQHLNLRSHWLLGKYCRPYLEKSENGIILIMASNHAYHTLPGCFPYNVSKTALTGLVRALAVEWGPKVRTVGIAPGFIETEGGEAWFRSFPDPERKKQKTIDIHPAGKLGKVEDVGALCAFLASDYATFITGATYLIDGGRNAVMQDV